MKKIIVTYLLDLGVKPHYKGFDYLVYTLTQTTQSPKRLPMGYLYELVAAKFSVTKDRVERCIRTVVSSYFQGMDSPPKIKYTNAEFIYLCTEQILLLAD